VKQDHPDVSVRRQCTLLSLTRSTPYYQPRGETAENLRFMDIIDKQFLETLWYGSRQTPSEAPISVKCWMPLSEGRKDGDKSRVRCSA